MSVQFLQPVKRNNVAAGRFSDGPRKPGAMGKWGGVISLLLGLGCGRGRGAEDPEDQGRGGRGGGGGGKADGKEQARHTHLHQSLLKSKGSWSTAFGWFGWGVEEGRGCLCVRVPVCLCRSPVKTARAEGEEAMRRAEYICKGDGWRVCTSRTRWWKVKV